MTAISSTPEPDTETEILTCQTCGQPFPTVLHNLPGLGRRSFASPFCNACAERRRAEALLAEENAAAAKKAQRWSELCPQVFRTPEEGRGETDVTRLEREQPRYREAMQWEFGPRGLLLVGPTGVGKTRVAWRILRREFEAGREVAALKAHRFGLEAVELQMSHGFLKWFNRLARVPLLFVDDLGKGKFTEAVESHFFGLIDERTERGLPLIVTTNATGSALAGRMSEDRGEPMVRRLREYCDAITFTK